MQELIERIEALDGQATPAPWSLCQHLKSLEHDKACGCGYRGVVWGPDHSTAYAVLQPGHELPQREEEYGSEPSSYDRAQQIADMHLLVELRNHLPQIIAALRSQSNGGE